MRSYEKLLLHNRAWAAEQLQDDPEYFQRLAGIQRPEFLWIGCSDSRVPSSQITGTQPGEMFVHRNIANLVVATDTNLLSVLEYAVRYLEVKHVIVCGHYGCGGVKASLGNHSFGIIDGWLRPLKDIARIHAAELDAVADPEARTNRLVELSVREQVENLAKTTVIQRHWQEHGRPHLHGWVYGLDSGVLKNLVHLQPGAELDPRYRFDDL
jgi:carbonic anhydrase